MAQEQQRGAIEEKEAQLWTDLLAAIREYDKRYGTGGMFCSWKYCDECANCEFREFVLFSIQLMLHKETWYALKLVLKPPIVVRTVFDMRHGAHGLLEPDERLCKIDDPAMLERAKHVCHRLTYKRLCLAQRYAMSHLEKLYALLGANGVDPGKSAASRFTRRDGDSACMMRVARCFFG